MMRHFCSLHMRSWWICQDNPWALRPVGCILKLILQCAPLLVTDSRVTKLCLPRCFVSPRFSLLARKWLLLAENCFLPVRVCSKLLVRHSGRRRKVKIQPVTAFVPAEYLLAGPTCLYKDRSNTRLVRDVIGWCSHSLSCRIPSALGVIVLALTINTGPVQASLMCVVPALVTACRLWLAGWQACTGAPQLWQRLAGGSWLRD